MTAGINWLALMSLALGGVVFVSIGQIIDLVRYRWRGTLTTGRVIHLAEEETSEGGGPVFVPIAEYRVHEKRWRIKSMIAMAPALYREGQEVPVYYFAESPGNARAVTVREYWKWIVVMLSCLLFLAILMANRA
jgi:Protein of unknown function (DUF3592)